MRKDNSSASTGLRAGICSNALSRMPEFRGKTRLVNMLGRLAMIAGRRWASSSPGKNATIRLDLGDRIQRQMWGGCYETHVQRTLKHMLEPGDVFLDIGAHIGYHAVLAAVLVGDRGKVIAFEADPGNFLRLQENFGPFRWACAVNKAIWQVTGNIGFERSSQPAESGWGTLTDVRDLNTGDHRVVEAISLDDWFLESKLKVSVMKVDAEGSEVGILRGAHKFLRTNRPVIIIEANDVVLRQAQTSALELAEILRGDSFEIFEFNGKLLDKLGAGRAPKRNELLALPRERAQQQFEKLQVG
ncbi:MAG: FkbM family methyltransferase [Candidatus Acidiferrales bacterium]